jgi:hypothetical protein
MAWTTPRTWVTNEIVTAAQMNAHVRDNTRFLKGLDGNITLEDRVIIDSDANFYAEIDGGSDALLSMDSTDTFKYDRGANFFQFNVGGAEQARIDVDGVQLASGNYVDYNGVYYPVVTDEGTQKIMVWGQQGVSWTGGQDTNQNVATGLTTVESFSFAILAGGTISGNKIATSPVIAGGTVPVVSQSADTESGTIFWIAVGV